LTSVSKKGGDAVALNVLLEILNGVEILQIKIQFYPQGRL